MARRRRARSNLYQVDFIAALFGAFLLLWISKPTGTTGEPETAVVVMESSCEDQVSILPQGAERCVDKDVLQLTDPSLNLKACSLKPIVRVPFEWYAPIAWDAVAYLAPFVFSSKATGRDLPIKFSGLAIVATDNLGQKFRAVGYGTSTPPDQLREMAYTGWVAASACPQHTCALYYHLDSHPSSLNQTCTIRVYSRAWPKTCLSTTVQPGDVAAPFDLKPCES